MNISIFGLGYVGCVSSGCLAQNGHKVTGVDISKEKAEAINSGKATIIEKDIDEIIKTQRFNNNLSATQDYRQAVLNTEISIICVGTPSSKGGNLDLSHIYAVTEQIAETLKEKNEFHIISIRSTIEPGTVSKCVKLIEEKSKKKENKDFCVLANPEFLREGTAVYDFYHPPYTLIGTNNAEAAEKYSRLFRELPAEIIITDTGTAEIMKYVNNTYHALKISFANEIGNICKSIGLDSHKVMDIFCKDKILNISPYYFKPGFAYGGSCLPKDLKALETIATENSIEAPIIQSIEKSNSIQIEKATELIISFKRKKIGIIGLSFKEGTDDYRNSPIIEVINSLLKRGLELRAYDKNIILSHLTGKNKEYLDNKLPGIIKILIRDINALIENSEIIVIANKEYSSGINFSEMKDKIIVDLVRADEKTINKNNYHGICW